jgi:adenylate cyclase
LVYRYLTEEREKHKIQQLFGQYVSDKIVQELIEEPKKIKLGGEIREVSILFADIRGFTNIAEKLSAEETITFLNKYFDVVVKIILENEGIVDKFLGDGIMAVFGSPVENEKHPQLAYETAYKMQEAVFRLNQRLSNKEISLSIGIGINTGTVVIGNVGASLRKEYTVIGDEVNLSARLQTLAAPKEIVISEATYQRIPVERKKKMKVEEVKIKGKEKKIKIYRSKVEPGLSPQH